MPVNLGAYLTEKATLVERELERYLDCPEPLAEAMRYAVLGGGKRIRPILMLAAAELLKVPETAVLPAACALEMVHAFSLVHDDLPCMDDDDLRRGRPSCHKRFGEATALLAGDALLVYAFELIARDGPPEHVRELLRGLAAAAGLAGLAGGQLLDLSGAARTLPELEKMHARKTGALLKYAVTAPLGLADDAAALAPALQEYAAAIGLAFQIKDDILDVEGAAGELGKTPGKDLRQHKNTYVTLLGLERAKELLQQETNRAYQAAAVLGGRLLELAQYLLGRKK